MITRREFSKVLLAAGTANLALESAFAAAESNVPAEPQSTNQMCDLLIKGGTVIDPSQQLHAPMDVAVKDRKIFEVARDIPESRALQVYSAKDRVVTPGWIDLHTHCNDGVATGFNADHYCLGRGTTTCVDAGSTGFVTVGPFIRDVVRPSNTRIHPLVEIGVLGTLIFRQWPHYMRDLYNMHWVLPDKVANAVRDNRPDTVGVKIHLDREISTSPLEFEMALMKKAVEAAELCHQPMMVHALNCANPLPDLMKLMRKGDVLTHCYNGFPNGILDDNGKIRSGIREARERGILFDVAEGHVSISFAVAEKALQQDFLPDTISSDLTVWATSHTTGDLPNVASTMMAFGMSLDQVIAGLTAKPAQTFDFGIQIGTLKPGAEADISIFELREGNFEFIDNYSADAGGQPVTKMGRQKLVNKAVVCRGQLWVNQL